MFKTKCVSGSFTETEVGTITVASKRTQTDCRVMVDHLKMP